MTTLARTDYLAVARHYADNPDSWPVAPRWRPDQRWYHRIAGSDRATGQAYEVWLLTWLPGQGTDLHDHGGSAGGLVVVAGELVERSLLTPTGPGADARARAAVGGADPDGPVALSDRVFTAAEGRHFGRHHVHQLTNLGAKPAISVHVYGPELSTMTRYHLNAGRLVVAGVERAGVQW